MGLRNGRKRDASYKLDESSVALDRGQRKSLSRRSLLRRIVHPSWKECNRKSLDFQIARALSIPPPPSLSMILPSLSLSSPTLLHDETFNVRRDESSGNKFEVILVYLFRFPRNFLHRVRVIFSGF